MLKFLEPIFAFIFDKPNDKPILSTHLNDRNEFKNKRRSRRRKNRRVRAELRRLENNKYCFDGKVFKNTNKHFCFNVGVHFINENECNCICLACKSFNDKLNQDKLNTAINEQIKIQKDLMVENLGIQLGSEYD